jgi:hypothetical protein
MRGDMKAVLFLNACNSTQMIPLKAVMFLVSIRIGLSNVNVKSLRLDFWATHFYVQML